MAMLGPLPARKALSEEIEDATYAIVMDGMTAHGLEEAVRAALRGEHGSTFFPSPPELKHLYDKAMEWHERELDRIHRREQIDRERIPPRDEPSPEAKARVAALYADFCKSYEKLAAADTLKLDPALVALVPDNPKSPARQRMGKAA
jgi:hypothetical protein